MKTQCTARCSRACGSAEGEHLIYNRTPANSRLSEKNKNIANSQYFAALHRDSKSGIPHLHLVVNRIDMDGNLNDVKFIGERVVMAAKSVNQRHGWKDAMEFRQERIAEVTKACMDVLRSMPFFD